jgi:hypothetical protein
MSNYLENEVLDHVLGKGTRDFTSPTTLAVALFTSLDSTESTTDEPTFTEVANANSYARTAVTFSAASNGSASNSGDVTFAAASGGNFGTVTHIGVYDSATYGAGNLLFYGALSVSKTVQDGDTFEIQAGNLTITLD